jgi:GT2 family glycosyltransferase
LAKVTIIVPVYADWPSLKDCIESLKQNVDEKHSIILVNDCGPDVDTIEKNIQKSIKGHKNFSYFRNPKNLGFVKNCNRAVMQLDKSDNDIMLLNSDTKTTPGFLEQMLSVLSIDKIGVVSPRSNNATICTFPLSVMKNDQVSAEQSYEMFNKFSLKFPDFTITPTGHGFCMLIRRSLIKKYGLFDEAFGKGYGEEVDFCQRIRNAGWQCVLANHAYVFHLEARSFSIEAKQKILEVNNKIIRERYPYYQKEVRDYIDTQLEAEARLIGGSRLKHIAKRVARKIKASLRNSSR